MNKDRKIAKAKKIGDYYYFKNNNLKAIKSYLKYINLRNNKENIYLRLAYCYEDIGNLNKALFYTNIGLKISSGEYLLIKLKGEILKSLGREKEAKKYIEKIKKWDYEMSKNKLDLDKFYG